MKHMNYEMAVGTVIPGKGKYGGKTMGQVAVESTSTIQWFAEQYSGPNNLVPAAAKVILQKAMPMAGLKDPAESFFLRGKGRKRPGCIMICLGLIMEYWMWCRCCISESGGETIMTAQFCGETHGKLNINVEKNVFRCNRCDASGGMLKLYADLHNVTLSEANQQIREALGKGEYRTDYIKATPVQEEKATAELAPIEEIHRTYQRMLSMLTLTGSIRRICKDED